MKNEGNNLKKFFTIFLKMGLFIFICYIAFSDLSLAQWQRTNLPFDITFYIVAKDSNIFLADLDGTVYKSNDDGKSWKSISKVWGKANVPGQVDYEGKGGRGWKRIRREDGYTNTTIIDGEGVKSWKRITKVEIPVVGFSINGKNLYVCTAQDERRSVRLEDCIYVSTNDGVSWNNIKNVPDYSSNIKMIDKYIFVGTGSRLECSSDNGKSWNTVFIGDVNALEAYGSDILVGSVGLVRSSNYGKDWEFVVRKKVNIRRAQKNDIERQILTENEQSEVITNLYWRMNAYMNDGFEASQDYKLPFEERTLRILDSHEKILSLINKYKNDPDIYENKKIRDFVEFDFDKYICYINKLKELPRKASFKELEIWLGKPIDDLKDKTGLDFREYSPQIVALAVYENYIFVANKDEIFLSLNKGLDWHKINIDAFTKEDSEIKGLAVSDSKLFVLYTYKTTIKIYSNMADVKYESSLWFRPISEIVTEIGKVNK